MMREIFPIVLLLAVVGMLVLAVSWGRDMVGGSPYTRFTAECSTSTIQTQYIEQHGKRAMVVQCERAK